MLDQETTAAPDDVTPEVFATPAGSKFATPTGLRVRDDLYDEEYSNEEYEQMLSLYEGTMASIAEGEIVKSKVLRVTENAVILDVGFKSEGSVPLDEFNNPQDLKEGDEVEVFLEHLEDHEGAVVLSKKKADFMRVWEKIRVAYENNHLGGVDGLLHITDMSYGRVSHPSEMVQIGSEVEIKILDIDWQRERISLGMKQLQSYPWQNVAAKYPVGTRVQGKVVSITNYGAFVELEPGIEGLVHISEMSWTRNVRHPSKIVSIGETIDAVVLKVDESEEKISLGMKQTEQDPWMILPLKYPVGTRLQGKVRNLTSFGAFVEIEPGIDGLIHISDMSWTKRVQHPSEVVKKGDGVDVIILNIDAENKRISLGLKQAQEDPWLRIGETYPIGLELRGTATRLMDKGVVVDVGNDIEGFVPMSQLGVPNIENPGDAVKEGQPVDLKVLEVDPIHHRIVLAVIGYPDIPFTPLPPSPLPPSDDESEAEAAAE